MGFEIVIQGITLETCRKGGRKSLSGFSTLLTPEQNKAVPELPSEADWQAFIDDSGTFMLQASRKIAAASDLPYPQASAKIREAVAPITDSFQKEMLIAAVLFPDFTQAATKRTGDEAHANVVRAAAKLLAWKRVHGSFPDKLEQAMPTVPADLFDLKPLRYRREGNGFVVYSVGQTGKFDGGTATVKPDAKESLFRYPRPAYLDQEAKPK
jgi:hypothetical protein